MKSESNNIFNKMMLTYTILIVCLVTIKADDAGDVNNFETAHKIPLRNENFETSHKVNADRSIIKENLQSFQSKEKPELNPVLSALIGEDIKTNIEQKRAAENFIPTTARPILATTKKTGLIDKSVNLDEAGSENKQTSRIQIKKGPNGQDYEYEYVYYYYDEDEKDSKKSETTVQQEQRGKNRYSTIDRSTTLLPEINDIVPRGKGRSAPPAPITEQIDEERLPLNTRFPPRSKTNQNSTPSPNENNKRANVKRPSLELVDSHSFNTDEKLTKGRIAENEKAENLKLTAGELNESTTQATSIDDETTPLIMDKDSGTTISNLDEFEATTIEADETTDELDQTTEIEQDETTVPATTTTTTTTTTEAPTTTTTTTTETPVKGGLPSAGRNRFRFRSQNQQTSTTEASSADVETSTKIKSRFSRPSYGSGARRTSAAPKEIKETITKEDVKPVASSRPLDRTRNRFNLRGTTTTEKSSNENQNEENVSIEGNVSTTTARTLRARPTFNLRGRSRQVTASTTTTVASTVDEELKEDDEKLEVKPVLPTRPSRIGLARPQNRFLARGRSPALNNLNKIPAVVEQTSSESTIVDDSVKTDEITDEKNSEQENEAGETSTAATSGINRLKNRPRIQINQKAERVKTTPVAINRKPNPLLGRRKIGVSTTTPAAVVDEEDDKEIVDESSDESEKGETEGPVEIAEPSTEATPRGLGLLGNRRRLPLRRPGTLQQSTS